MNSIEWERRRDIIARMEVEALSLYLEKNRERKSLRIMPEYNIMLANLTRGNYAAARSSTAEIYEMLAHDEMKRKEV